MRIQKHIIINCIISLFGFALVALLMSLGFWQLHRAQYKRELLATFSKRQQSQAISLTVVSRDPAAWQYQQVKLRGHFDSKHSFLLDNQFHQHHVGYQVFTPFVIAGGKERVLVNRGWIGVGVSRDKLPHLQQISGVMTLHGLVYRPLKKMMVLKHITAKQLIWPNRIQRLDFNEMARKLGYSVESFVILLNADQAHGFIRQWKPVIMPAAKHTGYAVQWFALAATLMIIILIMFYRMSRKKEVDHHASQSNPTHAKQTV